MSKLYIICFVLLIFLLNLINCGFDSSICDNYNANYVSYEYTIDAEIDNVLNYVTSIKLVDSNGKALVIDEKTLMAGVNVVKSMGNSTDRFNRYVQGLGAMKPGRRPSLYSTQMFTPNTFFTNWGSASTIIPEVEEPTPDYYFGQVAYLQGQQTLYLISIDNMDWQSSSAVFGGVVMLPFKGSGDSGDFSIKYEACVCTKQMPDTTTVISNGMCTNVVDVIENNSTDIEIKGIKGSKRRVVTYAYVGKSYNSTDPESYYDLTISLDNKIGDANITLQVGQGSGYAYYDSTIFGYTNEYHFKAPTYTGTYVITLITDLEEDETVSATLNVNLKQATINNGVNYNKDPASKDVIPTLFSGEPVNITANTQEQTIFKIDPFHDGIDSFTVSVCSKDYIGSNFINSTAIVRHGLAPPSSEFYSINDLRRSTLTTSYDGTNLIGFGKIYLADCTFYSNSIMTPPQCYIDTNLYGYINNGELNEYSKSSCQNIVVNTPRADGGPWYVSINGPDSGNPSEDLTVTLTVNQCSSSCTGTCDLPQEIGFNSTCQCDSNSFGYSCENKFDKSYQVDSSPFSFTIPKINGNKWYYAKIGPVSITEEGEYQLDVSGKGDIYGILKLYASINQYVTNSLNNQLFGTSLNSLNENTATIKLYQNDTLYIGINNSNRDFIFSDITVNVTLTNIQDLNGNNNGNNNGNSSSSTTSDSSTVYIVLLVVSWIFFVVVTALAGVGGFMYYKKNISKQSVYESVD